MSQRLVHAYLLIALLIIPATIPATATAASNDHFDLALRWAPKFYCDIHADNFRAEIPTDIYFDRDVDAFPAGDGIIMDNWDNLDLIVPNARVYYAVIESETHYFISYFLYHPRDWESLDKKQENADKDWPFGIEHEHDLEGVTLVVTNPGEVFVVAYTQAHGDTYYFSDGTVTVPNCNEPLEGYPVSSWDHRDGGYGNGQAMSENAVMHFEGSRPLVFVEREGHGIGQIRRAVEPDGSGPYLISGTSYRFYDNDGIVLTPSADGVSSEMPLVANAEYEYGLVSFADEIWANRDNSGWYSTTHPILSTMRNVTFIGLGATFAAGTGHNDGASPPWAWQELKDCPELLECLELDNVCAGGASRGDWFMDPAQFAYSHIDDLSGISRTYVDNEFLVGDNRILVDTPGTWNSGDSVVPTWTIDEAASGNSGISDTCVLQLVDAADAVAWTSSSVMTDTETATINVPPIASGTYRLRVKAHSDVAGGEFLPISGTSAPFDVIGTDTDYEPNDSFTLATPIEVGTDFQYHTITDAGDEDYLAFPVVEGYAYTVKIEDETGSNVQFYMYDHLQNAIGGWYESEAGYVCGASGTHYIRVHRWGGLETGSYSIRVIPGYWNGENALTWDSAHEPTPNAFCAYPMDVGSSVTNTIDSGDDQADYFRFTATYGNTYFLDLFAETDANFQFYLYYMNTNHGLENIGGWFETESEFTCTRTGTYIVRVRRYGGEHPQGSYGLSVTSFSSTYHTEVQPRVVYLHPGDPAYGLHASGSNSSAFAWSSSDETLATVDGNGNVTAVAPGTATILARSMTSSAAVDSATVFIAPVGDHEPNTSFVQATPIPVGTDYQVHSIAAADDEDYLSFPVIEGYGYTVKLEAELGSNVQFYMYDHLQTEIGGWYESEAGYVCGASGTHYIRVHRWGGLGTGKYTIRVIPSYWNGEDALAWNAESEPSSNMFCSQPMATDGTPVFHPIGSGDDAEDYFRFTATYGNTYFISLTQERGANVQFYLYYLSRNHGAENIGGWYETGLEYACERTGTYIVRVRTYGGLSEGDYRLAISSLATTYETEVQPQTIYLHPGDPAYGLHASSSNSSGFLWSSSDEALATVDASGNVSALAPGTVTVRARSADSAAVVDSATVFVGLAGDHEPNDSFVQATPIPVGTEYQVHTIFDSGDEDYLSFPVVQGYGYTVKLEDELGSNVQFYLYDHLQAEIGGWYESEAGYVCGASGTHYIRVRRWGGLGTGKYTIRVIPSYWNGENALVWNAEDEPSSNMFCARPLATDGVSVFNTIGSGDDGEDYFRFTATYGNTYFIALSQERGCNVQFYLYYLNRKHGAEEIGGWYEVDREFLCGRTGTYIVRVRTWGGRSEGDYRISLSSLTTTYEPEVQPQTVYLHPGDPAYGLHASSSNSSGFVWTSSDESLATVDADGNVSALAPGTVTIRARSLDSAADVDSATVFIGFTGDHEPNDSFVQATPIPVGNDYQVHSVFVEGDEDYLQFPVVAGRGYTVMVESETGSNVQFYMYDHLQNAIGGWYESEAGYVCGASGTHYIRVRRWGGLGTGNYTVRVIPAYWNDDVAPAWDSGYEPNPNHLCAYRLLADGTPVFNTIGSGDDTQDYFRFGAAAGRNYFVTLSAERGANVHFYLYSEDSDHGLTNVGGWYETQAQVSPSQTTYYVIRVERYGGLSEGDYRLELSTDAPGGVDETPAVEIPDHFALMQNYPNPFNPQTAIRFALPEAGPIKLYVYGVDGRRIRVLAEGHAAAGWHSVIWDGKSESGRQVPSGVYFLRMEAAGFSDTRRMVLIK